MPFYINAKGQKFEVPADPTPEELAWIEREGLKPETSTFKDVLKSGVSGVLGGALKAPLIAGDIAKLGSIGLNMIRPGTISDETVGRMGSGGWEDAFKDSPQDKWLKEKLGIELAYQPQTTGGRYTKAATEAVGGAGATGAIGSISRAVPKALSTALTPASIGINAAAGAAGQGGLDLTEGNPIAGVAAGALTGTAGNIARNIGRSNYPQSVYNATRDMTPQQWETAGRAIPDFRAAGSSSFTLADLPELGERIRGDAVGMTNTTGGNLLRHKLGPMRTNQDIPNILNQTRESIAPAGDMRQLADQLSRQGQEVTEGLVRNRSRALMGELAHAGEVPENALLQASIPVRGLNLQPGNQAEGMQAAIRAAETALLGRDSLRAPMIDQVTPPILNVQSLSQQVKDLNNLPNGTAGTPAGSVSAFQARTASDAADQALRTASPQYSTAMDRYGDFNDNILRPMELRLPGTMQGANSDSSMLGKLRDVPEGMMPSELSALRATPDQEMQVARLLSDQIKPIPHLSAASPQQMGDRAHLQSILSSLDPQFSERAMRNIWVADRLSMTAAQNAADRTQTANLSNNAISKITSPFGSTARWAGLRTAEKEVAQLSEIIGNPTPENLNKLRELAKVDPRAQRMLEWISTLVGASQSGME